MKIKHLLTKTLLVAAGLLVGQSVWADEVNATLDHTASSSRNGDNAITTTVDAEYEHYNNTKAAAWGGWAYAQFSFTIPAGHSIVSATLTWSTSIGGNNTTTRNNDIYYVDAGTTIDYANLTSTTNVNLNGTFIVNVQKAGKTVHKDIETDVTSAVRAIAASQNYIIFKWTNSASSADLFGKTSTDAPTLVITTTAETFYTATFNANEGAITPSVTVYTDEERTTPIAKDALSANTTYYYRATLAGYNDYEGSFDVATSNPTVNFTMTAKTRYTFTVNAVDAGSNILKTIYTDADSYEGKIHTMVYPKYLTGTGNIVTYSKDDDTYGESKTAQAKNETYTVSYTAYDGVAYFVEVEDVVSASAYGSWNCSNGGAVRGFTTAKDIFTVPATGVYDITYAACNNNVSYALAVTLSKNETEIATKSDLQSVSVNFIKSTGIVSNNNVSLASGDVLKLTPSSTNGIIDYMLVELKSVPATIPSSGFATISSAYPLDCEHLPSGLTAYKVSGYSSTSATLEPVTEAVAASTGLILEGTAGQPYSIPVVASGTDISATNKLHASVTPTLLPDGTFYVLKSGKFLLVEGAATEAARTVPDGKAYLLASEMTTTSPELSLSFGNLTGIESLTSASSKNEGVVYDLQGRKVVQPTKGLYIVNGKKVVIK